MGSFQDLSGQKFGKLTAIKVVDKTTRFESVWLCKCDCGNLTKVPCTRLKSGKTKSCGSYNVERLKNRSNCHGKTKTRVYTIWGKMKSRCTQKNSPAYKRYGGRGITVCDEWSKNFMNFYNWSMANGYQDNLTIDRIDNDKGYYPDNCRWVTMKEQQNNRSTNHFIEHNGEKLTIAQWAEKLNVYPSTIYDRIRKYENDYEKILFKGDLRRGTKRK